MCHHTFNKLLLFRFSNSHVSLLQFFALQQQKPGTERPLNIGPWLGLLIFISLTLSFFTVSLTSRPNLKHVFVLFFFPSISLLPNKWWDFQLVCPVHAHSPPALNFNKTVLGLSSQFLNTSKNITQFYGLSGITTINTYI